MAEPEDKDLPPEFLDGTFNWRMNGLFFDAPPPLDLLTAAALNNPDPWVVVAAILERAKRGDHGQVRRLETFFEAQEPFALNRVALLLVGDAGTERDLKLLEQVLRGDNEELRVYAAEAARLAGRLWLVPAMLAAWWRAEDLQDRETIGFAISDMVEPEPEGGPLAEAVSVRYLIPPVPEEQQTPAVKRLLALRAQMDFGPPPFPGLVNAAFDKLVAKCGGDQAVVWGGAVFDVTAFARQFLALAPTLPSGICITYRHKFEAVTGVDCTRFFRDLAPQRLEMEATLEEFLHTDPGARFPPGPRYFFGHRIPD